MSEGDRDPCRRQRDSRVEVDGGAVAGTTGGAAFRPPRPKFLSARMDDTVEFSVLHTSVAANSSGCSEVAVVVRLAERHLNGQTMTWAFGEGDGHLASRDLARGSRT